MQFHTDKHGLDAVKTPSDLDIAWAAGVYEGEGSCCRSGQGKRSFVVSLAQKDPEILYGLRDLFGGRVGEYPNDRGTNKNGGVPVTIYAWRVCGNRARVFLSVIYSYLTARRKAQIDATPVRIFLDLVGAVPQIGALSYVVPKLIEYETRYRATAESKRKQYLKEFHENRKADDPNYMETRRRNTRAWRERSKVVSIA